MHKLGKALRKPGQPALIMTYGSTPGTCRPLDRDLLVIGRARSCDVVLVSPEVAAVHCVLRRTADGWRVRDLCGGRHATRLNGRAVQEETLRDTDVLHIGTFSFEVRLPIRRDTPVVGSTPAVDPALADRLRRLQRSRRNLIRLALRLRRRARRAALNPPSLAELQQQADSLRRLRLDYEARLREYDSRLADVEKAEQELCDERAAWERERLEWRTRLEQAEYAMARQQAEAPPPREGVRERLERLSRLRAHITGSAPSAPGGQIRPADDLKGLPAEGTAADCTAAAAP